MQFGWLIALLLQMNFARTDCVPTQFFDFFGVTSSGQPSKSYKYCLNEYPSAGACVDINSLQDFLGPNARSISTDFRHRMTVISQNFTQFIRNASQVCLQITYQPIDFYLSRPVSPTPRMNFLCQMIIRYSAHVNAIMAGFTSEVTSESCLNFYKLVMAGAFCMLSSGAATDNIYIDYSSFYLGVVPTVAIQACKVCGYTFLVNSLIGTFLEVSDSNLRKNSELQMQHAIASIDALWSALQQGALVASDTAPWFFQTFFYMNKFNFEGFDFSNALAALHNLDGRFKGRLLVTATFGFKFMIMTNGTDVWSSGLASGFDFVKWEGRMTGWLGILLILIAGKWL